MKIKNFIPVFFVIFLLSVSFSYAYSLNWLEINKSSTSFPLYNVFFTDVAALLLILITLINLYWHKKSLLAHGRHTARYVPTLVFVIFAFLSLLWSGSLFLSGFWGLRLLIAILALLLVTSLVQSKDYYHEIFFKTFIAAGVLESLISFGQFAFQKSLGLHFLGEGRLGAETLGLAKVSLFGETFLRVYGTFPHPNVLGGFLLFTIVATWWYKPLRNKNILLIIQLVGLGLTFSRSAILGLLILILLAPCRDEKFCVSTQSAKKKVLLISSLALIFSLFFLIRTPIQNILSGRDESTHIRLEYAKAAYSRFIDSPLLGRGWGTGPVELAAYSSFPFYPWEMQPVHNIYLLVLSDLGIFGFLAFSYFIYHTLLCRDACLPARQAKFCVSTAWKNLFIAYLFIGLFDHYLLTLPQGIFIFFASALLACELRKKTEKILPKAASSKTFLSPG